VRSRLTILAAVMIGIAIAILWSSHHRDAAKNVERAGSATAATSGGVRRLAPDERRRLGEQIVQAIAHAHANGSATSSTGATGASSSTGAGSAPALDDLPRIPLEQIGQPLHDAMTAAIPLLASCFKQHGSLAVAQMTMWSDPDTGTVIDTKALHDDNGQPLEPAVESCMRDTIDSLELPPLGQPGTFDLQYSFKSD
jgi:hypothetical protein